MREWCSCGSAFHSLSRRAVKDWRANHHHGKADPEPEKSGANAMVERAGFRAYESEKLGAESPIVQVGFTLRE